MKNIRIFLSLIAVALFAISCEVEGISTVVPSVTDANAGNNSKIFDISTDNTGTVRITPLGTGVSKSTVQFGHGSGASASATVMPGQSVTHAYPEGNYSVTITSYDLSGKETVTTYPLLVTYVAPTNLKIATEVSGLKVKVTPTAVNAKGGYKVFFGDVANEAGVIIPEGGNISHTYPANGTYTIKVIALSGGKATTEATTSVTVFVINPLVVTFDDPAVNYYEGGVFGGVGVDVIDNPFSGGINTTAKVWKFTKGTGAETWAGTWTPVKNGISIDNGQKFKVWVYATETGKSLHFQLEAGDYKPGIDVPITVANQWQELTFDFSSLNIPAGQIFSQYVFQYNLSGSGAGEVIYIDNITQTK